MALTGDEHRSRPSGADWSAWVADSVLYANSKRPGRDPKERPHLTSDQLRVSDAERSQVAEALARHYSDGRLDHDELEERLQAAMAAKTRGDLEPLLADLPDVVAPPPPPPPRSRHVAAADHLSRVVFALADLLILLLVGLVLFQGLTLPWIWLAVVVVIFVRRRLRHGGQRARRYHAHLHRHGTPHWHGPNGPVIDQPPAGY